MVVTEMMMAVGSRKYLEEMFVKPEKQNCKIAMMGMGRKIFA